MSNITLKVSASEASRMRAAARGTRVTPSEFVRKKVRGKPKKKKSKPLLTRCNYTGVMIFAGNPDYPPLTTETVREMLADFP